MIRALLLFVFFALNLATSGAQVGIYSENDIKLQDIYIEAQLEKHKKNYDKQIELLREVIRRSDDEHAAYYEIARAYMAKNDLEEAEKYALQANEIEPANEWYLVLLVDIYEQASYWEKAIDYCQKLLEAYPQNTVHIERLAYNQLKAKKDVLAINNLKKIEQIEGVQEDLSRKIFEIHDNKGRFLKAAETLEELSDAYPTNVRYLNNWAGYLYEHGYKDKALEVYNRVLKLDDDNSTALLAISREKEVENPQSKLFTIKDLINKEDVDLDLVIKELVPFVANMSREGQQTDELLSISSSLVEKYPNDAKTNSLRADVLFYSGNIKDSELLYKRAVDLDDSRYSLWDQWMLNLWELENHKKLQQVANDAVDYFPNQVNPLLFLSVALYLQGDKDESNYYIEEAKLVAGNNKSYDAAIFIIENWMSEKLTNLENFNTKLASFTLTDIYNPMLYEMIGDIFYKLADPVRTKDFWNKAVNFGADKNRIQHKIGQLN